MMHRLTWGLMFLACAGVVILEEVSGNPNSAEACGRRSRRSAPQYFPTQVQAPADEPVQTQAALACTDCVCPAYPYAQFNGVFYFYAEHCEDKWVSLASTSPMTGSCRPTPSAACVDVGMPPAQKKKELAGKKYHAHKDLISKGHKKKAPVANPTPPTSTGAILLGSIFATLEVKKAVGGMPAKTIKVMLYQYQVTPPGNQVTDSAGFPLPTRIFGSGVEVDSPDTPVITISHAAITAGHGTKVAMIKLGIDYQIVVDEKTVIAN